MEPFGGQTNVERSYLGRNARAATRDFAESGVFEVGQARTFLVALVQEQVPQAQGLCFGLQLLHDWGHGLKRQIKNENAGS